MKLLVLAVGKRGVRWSEDAIGDYRKRLSRYGGVEERFVKAETFRGDVDAVRRVEGERLLQAVGPRDQLVVLDERGDDLDTERFTALVEEARVGGVHQLVFAIGGPYGHDPAVRAKGRAIRLSSLVLNHDLARVVLLEQLYRAMTLIHGVPYHH